MFSHPVASAAMIPSTSSSSQICSLPARNHVQLCRPMRGRQLQRAVSNGAKCTAFFKFKNPLRGSSEDAGIYASQTRDDFSEDDVEHYFNYMGMLATEGTYDRLNKMLKQGLPPVDLLLLMAAKENDAPKVAELLRAGADVDVKGTEGESAHELTTSEAVRELLQEPAKAFSV